MKLSLLAFLCIKLVAAQEQLPPGCLLLSTGVASGKYTVQNNYYVNHTPIQFVFGKFCRSPDKSRQSLLFDECGRTRIMYFPVCPSH